MDTINPAIKVRQGTRGRSIRGLLPLLLGMALVAPIHALKKDTYDGRCILSESVLSDPTVMVMDTLKSWARKPNDYFDSVKGAGGKALTMGDFVLAAGPAGLTDIDLALVMNRMLEGAALAEVTNDLSWRLAA